MWGLATHVSGGGEIGLWNNRSGTVSLSAVTDSLGAIEPFLETVLGPVEATRSASVQPPYGSVESNVRLTGAIGDLELASKVEAVDVRRGAVYVSRAELDWSTGSAGLQIQGIADSVDLGGKGFSLSHRQHC